MIMNNRSNSDKAILYSFRRCPFAIRARAAIYLSKIKVELREVLLRDKPSEMLDISSKGTVPVLELEKNILDESIDIMLWALNINDSEDILCPYREQKNFVLDTIKIFDLEFKYHLDRYKYSSRYLNEKDFLSREEHRNKGIKPRSNPYYSRSIYRNNSGKGTKRKKRTKKRKPIKINPKMKGVFTRKAKKKGMSVQKYAAYIIKKYKGKTKNKKQLKLLRQAVFAKTAKKWKKHFVRVRHE